MKIRPKVPVCTDCDHVFEYRGRNPGQLGGVVVQFGEAYIRECFCRRRCSCGKGKGSPNDSRRVE